MPYHTHDANKKFLISRETASKIRDGWNDRRGQGHKYAEEKGHSCVVVRNCDEDDALILSELFFERFSIRSCCHYDHASSVLSLYCGDAGVHSSLDATVEGIVRGFFAGKNRVQ